MERRRAGGGIGRVEGAALQRPLEGAVRTVMSSTGQTSCDQASSQVALLPPQLTILPT